MSQIIIQFRHDLQFCHAAETQNRNGENFRTLLLFFKIINKNLKSV